MTDVVLVIDASGRCLKIAPTNPLSDYKPSAEIVGKTLHEQFPTQQADFILNAIERLLLNILPELIAHRLKQDQRAIAEHFDQVTILFADIVGFTPLSARLQPIELVNMLNQIFSTFDQLKHKFIFEQRGEIAVKGKGDMITYWLLDRRN